MTNRQATEGTDFVGAPASGLQKRKKAPRQYLTDRGLKALAPAKLGQRAEIWDTKLPGFGVRVGDDVDKKRPGKAGRITFVLYSRFPGKAHPERRVLGQYDALTLELARAKAGDWLEDIRKGIDPRAEEARKREAATKAAAASIANSFQTVAEDFIREVAVGADPARPKQRRGLAVAADIRRTLVPVWADRPISEISRRDVREVIEQIRDFGTDGMLTKRGIKPAARKGRKGKGRPMPSQAGHVLAYAKQLFGWALNRDDYGLASSPCADLKIEGIEKKANDRTLSNDELFALWRAAERLPYPHGPVYKMLALTALRLNEVADASWPEFDQPNKIWTIPAERMKGKDSGKKQARAHAVPLNDGIRAVLETLPSFKRGKFLFSTTAGKSPVWMNSKVKARIDRRMLRTLRALERRRGGNPADIDLPHWTNHDIRRTVRSNLSRLKVTEEAREAVLAHARPGIKGTYDRYDYFDEKRDALDLWAARLRSIVNPPPANVVQIKGAGR